MGRARPLRPLVPTALALPALLLLAAPAPAHEEGHENPKARPGFYVGLAGAVGGEAFGDLVADSASTLFGLPLDATVSGGLNTRAGYRIASWLAVEAQYEWMAGFDLEVGRFDVGSLETHTFMVNPKLIVPFEGVQPYLVLGIGFQVAELDVTLPASFGFDRVYTNFAGRPGAGIDVYLGDHWVVNAEVAGVLPVTTIDTGTTTVDQLFYVSGSLGLQYRF